MRWNAAVAGLAASWGLISVIVAGVDLDAAVLVFHRLVLAAVTVAVAVALARRTEMLALPRPALALLVVGVALGAHWFLFFQTIKLSSVAVAVLTVYTAPIFLSLLAPLFLPEARSRVALGALVPASAGIALIGLAGGDGAGMRPLAVAAGLGAALTYAGLVIATKRLTAHVHPVTIIFWSYLVAGAALAPSLLAADRVLPTSGAVAYVVLLGVVFTALSGFVFVTLLRRVTAQAVGVLAYVEPVSAALLAWLILDQSLTPAVVVGGALIVAAGVFVVLREPSESAAVETGPLRPLPTAAKRD